MKYPILTFQEIEDFNTKRSLTLSIRMSLKKFEDKFQINLTDPNWQIVDNLKYEFLFSQRSKLVCLQNKVNVNLNEVLTELENSIIAVK